MTATSAAVKSVEASLRMNVINAVRPALRAAASELMETDGATVSIVSDGDSAPATLPTPPAFVKAAAATETVPLPTNPGVGVNVAE